ncbi:hypothetical protein AVEN_190875-1 [Araneus ventricosus]|uniref:Ig-like domain-containing protein n=1 Tax=Araneus ventricosus TaxID=182803 RepID=A0A4Y2CRV5_ARAVE|nr:hypothetical protein AVEN_190875-1 [Araneus ventricosus]
MDRCKISDGDQYPPGMCFLPGLVHVKSFKDKRFHPGIVILPKRGPTILGAKPRYSIADDLNVTCMSAPSKPPSFLQWFVNDKEIRRVWGVLHVKSYVVAKRYPVGVEWKFGEGVPAQVSSSSSDHGSKLRGPSQNSPRFASKLDANVTKLYHLIALVSPDV